jgi:hypothetical protein
MVLETMINILTDKFRSISALPLIPRTNLGKQFLDYGIKRRLSLIRESYFSLIESCPPERVKSLDGEETNLLTLHLNSLYFHIWGCVDNLAWLIAYELQFDNLKDTPTDSIVNKQKINLFQGRGKEITLRKWIKNKHIEFEMSLSVFDGWIVKLAALRHPTAHRIPLSLVPYIVTTKEGAGNWKSTVERFVSLFNKGVQERDLESLQEANVEFENLGDYGHFCPIFTHELKFDASGSIDTASLNPLYPTIVIDCFMLLYLIEICSSFLSSNQLLGDNSQIIEVIA